MMKYISDQVMVMYQGEVVECGSMVDVLVFLFYDLIKCLIVGYFGEVLIVDVWRKDW